MEVKALLEEIAKNEGIYDYKIERNCSTVKGEGYAGDITFVNIHGKDSRNNNKHISLVVKCASKSDALRVIMPLGIIYKKEIFMYNTVFPTFRQLEEETGLQPSFLAPKFYRGCTENKNEALILGNLKENGYQLYDRKKPMDDNHIKLVMKEYGRFHALSFALRSKNISLFERFAESLDKGFVQFMKTSNFIDNKCIKAKETLNKQTDKEALQSYEAFLHNLKPFLDEILKAPKDYNVILHGDCWTNNILFKYKDNNNPTTPTKLRFIDFQVATAGSPVLDLSYYFYSCSSKEAINKYMDYLQVYHSSLSNYLQKLGCDANKLFPYSIMQQHWKKYAKYGLIMAIQLIHVMYTEPDEAISLSDVADSGKNVAEAFEYSISNVDKYNDRVRHVILHFVENNLI